MHKVYLAGAMSHWHKENKIENAIKWRERAEKYFANNTDDFGCINPCNYFSIGDNYHTSDFEPMRFDLRKVKESRVVLVNLEALDKSLGTSDEILYAYLNDIPIVGFLEDESLLYTIHEWKNCQIDRIETGKGAQKRAMEYIKNYYG